MKEELDDFMLDESGSETIDFGKYLNILKQHGKALLWWTIGGFVLGCIFALAAPRKFVCTSKLAPELSSTATNRLSSAASMLGFTSSLLGTTDAVYPMVYPDLVKSPEFIVDLFDMPVDFVDKKDSVHTTLYDYMENYYGRTPVGNILFAPKNLVGKLMEKFQKKDDEDTAPTAGYNPYCLTRKQGMVYRILCANINAEIDKKTLVVTVKTTLDNRFICADICRKVNDNIKKYVTRYRTEKSIHDRDYYQKIYDQSKTEYLAMQDRYSRYVDSHQGIVLQSVKTKGDQLMREANLAYQLYSTNAQQLQSAEAKVQLETPVFAEIVSPTVPFKSASSRKKKALGFAFAGFIIGAAVVLLKNRKEWEAQASS